MKNNYDRIWEQNIASGFVLKLAQLYQKQGQLLESLLLFIKDSIASEKSLKSLNSLERIKDLKQALGSQQFCAVCLAIAFPPEGLCSFLELMELSFSSTSPSERNLDSFEEFSSVESLLESNAEFREFWPNYLQSFRQQLTANINNYSANSQQIEEDLQVNWNVFLSSFKITSVPQIPRTRAECELVLPWLNFQKTVGSIADSLPSPDSGLERAFPNLHLPSSDYHLTLSNLPKLIEEIEFLQEERAIESRIPFAFLRLIKTLRSDRKSVHCLVFSPDGKTLISGRGDSTIQVWDLSSDRNHILRGHTEAVMTLAMSQNGEVLASGSADNTVKLWNLSTSREIQTFIGHTSSVLSVAIVSSRKMLASAGADTTIKLWDLKNGELISTLTGHNSSVLSIAVASDSKTLASASADGTIKLWNLKTGELVHTLGQGSGWVFSVCFHPTKPVLVSTHEDRSIKFWNWSGGEALNTILTSEIMMSLAINPDGKTLACSGNSVIKAICLWNLNTGKIIKSLGAYSSSVLHSDLVSTVAFSPDGEILASGSKDSTIKLWGTNIEEIREWYGEPE